ncbi:DUF6438 domain-containing protein [Hymenobacter coalescens]
MLAAGLLCLPGTPVQAQLTPLVVPARIPNEVDELRTAAQVTALVRRTQAYPSYPPFEVDTAVRYPARYFAPLTVAGRPQPWVAADVDGNGYTDLLVLGKARNCPSAQLLMAVGPQRYQPLGFTSRGLGACQLPVVTRVEGRPAIVLYHHVTPRNGRESDAPLQPQRDTLVFRHGGLIEYNARPVRRRIERISFAAGSCYGSCPVFTLEIDAPGQARYHLLEESGARPGPPGWFAASIDAASWKELTALIDYLPLPSLTGRYAVPATDHPTVLLTITYDGGQQTSVVDYGLAASAGLRLLYDKLYQLRLSQQWQPTTAR